MMKQGGLFRAALIAAVVAGIFAFGNAKAWA